MLRFDSELCNIHDLRCKVTFSTHKGQEQRCWKKNITGFIEKDVVSQGMIQIKCM